jgi:hypothetical protein
MTENDLNTKWPLKYKLAERLEDAWVELPTQVSSEEMKNKKCHWDKNWGNKNMQNKSKRYAWLNSNGINNSLKAKYKNSYETKYWTVISKMDDDKLTIFIEKVDDIIEKVNNWNYSETTKNKYNAMLNALKEIAEDNLDEEVKILDGLFD